MVEDEDQMLGAKGLTDKKDQSGQSAHEAFMAFCRQKAHGHEDQPQAGGAKTVCPLCKGSGYHHVEREGNTCMVACRCRRKQRIEAALERANIPRKYRNYTLESKALDHRLPFKPWGGPSRDVAAFESQKRALEQCRRLRDMYIDHYIEGQQVDDLYGIMLYGDSGRGKTHLVCSLLTDLVYKGLWDVRFIEYNELFKQIRFSFKSQEFTYQGVFDSLTSPKILVIDDLGTDVGGDLIWVLDNVSYIVNERYNRNLTTIFTSNNWFGLEDEGLPQEPGKNVYEERSYVASQNKDSYKAMEHARATRANFENRINYRLRSRIREMCLEVKVEGYDYRGRIARNRNILLERYNQKRGD